MTGLIVVAFGIIISVICIFDPQPHTPTRRQTSATGNEPSKGATSEPSH